METNVSSLKKTARFTGLLYLIWIITGLYALFYIPSQINVKGDAVTTAQNILSNELLFRTGILNDIVSNVLWVFLVFLLYRLFKQVGEHKAKLMVALVIVQVPVVFIMGAFNITSLMIFEGAILNTFELGQRQDLAMFLLKINDYGSLILEMFWGLWLLPLAILVYKSRFLPRFLGVWLIVTGIYYVVLSITSIILPQYRHMLVDSPFAFPVAAGEVPLMLWLLIRGAKDQKPASAEAS